MALRILQFGVVFAIGFYLGPASTFAGTVAVTHVALSIQLQDPKDVTVVKGQSALLQCPVESLQNAGELKITWLHNGNPIADNDTRRYIQQTNGSLYIPKVIGNNKRNTNNNGLTGEYRCLATNSIGSILSNSAKLKTASIDRDFTHHQSMNLTVPEFQPAVFYCSIHSVPPAEIKWEFNTMPLPHNTRYVPLPSGALLITNTHSSDVGSYRCIATNRLLNNKKTKLSKIVQLTVSSSLTQTVAPTFLPLDILPNITVLTGENMNLYCAVTGWPIPTVQWLKNNNIVVSNSSVLQFNNVSLHDAGNYSCVANNSGGSLVQIYTVKVYEKPSFIKWPLSMEYPSAKTVRLDCVAKGVPEPEVYWLKNGKPLMTDSRIKKQPGGLVLSHTFTYDSGIYQCVAVNVAGTNWTAAQLVLHVRYAPSPPENVQCRSFNEKSICLTWQCPENVTAQAYSIYSVYTATRPEIYGPEFVTNLTHHLASDLNPSTNYTFYVRLYSKLASDQSLRVTCDTGIKGNRNLKVSTLNDSSVELTWSRMSTDVPCDDGTKAVSYKVLWKRKSRSASNSDTTENMNFIINGLSPGTEYEFRVVSTTYKSDNSPSVIFTTSGHNKGGNQKISNNNNNNTTDLIVKAPIQLEVTPITSTSVNLTWMDIGENTRSYSICYTDATKYEQCDETTLIDSFSNYLEITNLQPNRLYEFKVRLQNTDGYFSSFSEPVTIRTPSDVPSPVLHLKYKVVNETAACLLWQAPLHRNGKLTKYLISYTPDNNWPLESWICKTVPSTHNKKTKDCFMDHNDDKTFSTLLVDLKPDERYTVLVRAASDIGIGNPTVPIIVSTNLNSIAADDADDNNNNDSNGNYIPESQNTSTYNQKLGIIVGITIAIICIIFCISCILVRRQCLKSRAIARARMAASNNYYPAVAHYASQGSSVQVRLEGGPCSADMHEIEHLVGDELPTNIVPAVTPEHLDTKGSDNFPNGHLNGSTKPFLNGHLVNGSVHITENPRYYVVECNNGQVNRRKKNSECCNGYEEDSNSNLKSSKFQDLQRIFENSKQLSKKTNDHRDDECNSPDLINNSKTKLNDLRRDGAVKLSSSSFSSLDSMEDCSLNSTQITSCLDNSFALYANNHKRISPILGPNG